VGTGGSDGGGGGAGGTSAPCPDDMVGFATVPGPTAITTGGGTLAPVTVRTLADLMANAARTDPAVILVDAMIVIPTASQPFQIPVESNKTIRGIGANSGITGGGLLILGKENVIIQNLAIRLAPGVDSITVQASRHVWIDHCEFSNSRDTSSSGNYPWMVNIKHASDYVTVSWSRFLDQFNTCQIGHSDTNGTEDMGHLTVTYHHNLFSNTNSGTPRVRFGTVHVFNNHAQNVGDYGIASQMYAQVVAENNFFENVAVPLTNQQAVSSTSFAGLIVDRGNYADAQSGANVIGPATGSITFDPMKTYVYSPDSASSVPVLVDACAGTGKI
jgi:pectate lyase